MILFSLKVAGGEDHIPTLLLPLSKSVTTIALTVPHIDLDSRLPFANHILMPLFIQSHLKIPFSYCQPDSCFVYSGGVIMDDKVVLYCKCKD